jgi:hypothetical protein
MSSTLSNSRSGVAMDAAEPSIYINYVYENITRERIIETFTEVFAGEYIERVDMVRKTNTETEEEYFSVFIHLTSWPTGQAFQNIRQKLIDGKDFKLVYDSPWFWKCCASKMPKPSNKPKVRLSPFISCDEDEDKHVARSSADAKTARKSSVLSQVPRILRVAKATEFINTSSSDAEVLPDSTPKKNKKTAPAPNAPKKGKKMKTQEQLDELAVSIAAIDLATQNSSWAKSADEDDDE